MSDSNQDLKIPEKMLPWLLPKRYKIAKGGRGGAKSRTCAAILVRKGARQKLRWLLAREVQKSIAESVYALLVDEISRQGLTAHYDIQKNVIKGKRTGTTFIFIGLAEHTKDSIKSYENYDGVWVEEAHSVSKASWEILIPTFRRDADPENGVEGSEIWATYNLETEEDAIDVMVRDALAINDPDFLIIDINWSDNPWFPEVLNKERLRMLASDPDLYQHIWEGKYRSAAGMMFKRDWFLRHDRLPAITSTYIASDCAVTPDGGDYTEHGVWCMGEDGILYAKAWYYDKVDTSVWIEAWLELVRFHKPQVAFDEKGVINRSVDGAVKRRMRETNTFVQRESLPSASGKAARAMGFAARASAGCVSFPKTQWADRVINQLCSFNGEDGRVDDAVDVCSLIGRGLDFIHNPPAPSKAKKPPPKEFTQEWFDKLYNQDEQSLAKEKAHFR